MRPYKVPLLVLAIALLAQCGAMSAETSLVVPTAETPVNVRIFSAPGDMSRPTVLIVHGTRGIEPFAAAYERYANDLAAAGFDAWLFSYYAQADDPIMHGEESAPRIALYNARFRSWAKTVNAVADFALTQKASSGRIGMLGFSNGGFLAVGAAAANPRIGALVVFYGGIPDPVRNEIARLPPLLVIHGSADKNVPIAEGLGLAYRAGTLGGQVQVVIYPDEDHGFDFIPNRPDAKDARARVIAFFRRQLLDH